MPNYDDLIGTQFEWGGRGPDAYDCYGLVREMTRRAGLILPDYPSPTEGSAIMAAITGGLQWWEKVLAGPGVAVLLRLRDLKGKPSMHCGYMLDENRMIHAWKDAGGVAVERMTLWQPRILGFYRYVGPTT